MSSLPRLGCLDSSCRGLLAHGVGYSHPGKPKCLQAGLESPDFLGLRVWLRAVNRLLKPCKQGKVRGAIRGKANAPYPATPLAR